MWLTSIELIKMTAGCKHWLAYVCMWGRFDALHWFTLNNWERKRKYEHVVKAIGLANQYFTRAGPTQFLVLNTTQMSPHNYKKISTFNTMICSVQPVFCCWAYWPIAGYHASHVKQGFLCPSRCSINYMCCLFPYNFFCHLNNILICTCRHSHKTLGSMISFGMNSCMCLLKSLLVYEYTYFATMSLNPMKKNSDLISSDKNCTW